MQLNLRLGFVGLTVLIGTACDSEAPALSRGAGEQNVAAAAESQSLGQRDKMAIDALNAMAAYLSDAKTMSFRAQIAFDKVLKSGIKAPSTRMSVFLLQRPSNLRILTIAADGAARTGWFGGKRLTVFIRNRNQYMTLDFKGKTDELLDKLVHRYELELPLADLLLSNIKEKIDNGVRSAKYLGQKIVADVTCNHVSFTSDEAEWQIWIEADDTPVPRRFGVVYVKQKQQPSFLADLNIWKIDPPIGLRDFEPALPFRAKKVPFGPE